MNKIIKDRIEKAAESYVERKAFIAGASFALNHQWISLEERLPERDEGTDYSVEVSMEQQEELANLIRKWIEEDKKKLETL